MWLFSTSMEKCWAFPRICKVYQPCDTFQFSSKLINIPHPWSAVFPADGAYWRSNRACWHVSKIWATRRKCFIYNDISCGRDPLCPTLLVWLSSYWARIVRANYGVPVVKLKSDLRSVIVIAVTMVILWWIWPRYNGIRLYVKLQGIHTTTGLTLAK